MSVAGEESLFLGGGDVPRVRLHPLVLFGILDHQTRRVKENKRVIGTLLGKRSEGVVEVTNYFPVPHLEKGDDEVAIGMDFNRSMVEMHKAVDPSEEVVGWYATTPDGKPISNQSALIHQTYSDAFGNPVHVVVDATLETASISAKAFVAVPLPFVEHSVAAQFQQAPVELVQSEAEQIALDVMSRTAAKEGEWDGTAEVASELDTLEMALGELHAMLGGAAEYVDDVVAGKRAADAETGRQIAEALAAVPRLSATSFDKILEGSMSDLLMIVYLTNMTRTQAAIAERLQLFE